LSLLVVLGLSACSDDKKETTESGSTTTAAPTGSPSVSVTMTEYAFNVSGPLTAGGTVKLANQGKEFHMAFLTKLKEGKTLADVQNMLEQQSEGGEEQSSTTEGQSSTTEGQSSTTSGRTSTTAASAGQGEEQQGEEQQGDPFSEIGDPVGPPGGFMGPGQTADVTVPNLTEGTYAMMCFLPTEGEGTPHFAKGMVNQLQVTAGTAPPAPTADATYKVAPGKAVEGPTTLTAGNHTLKFEAAAGSEQLEPALAKLNPGTTMAELEEAGDKLFAEGSGPPPKNAASQLPGAILYGSIDLGSTTTFYVSANFTAGTWAIDAADTDAENRPKPPKETIEIKVT
jgi:hypothetical protein